MDSLTKYNVCDDEGTIIGVIWAYDRESAVDKCSSMYGIEKCYLFAHEHENQSPSKHTSLSPEQAAVA